MSSTRTGWRRGRKSCSPSATRTTRRTSPSWRTRSCRSTRARSSRRAFAPWMRADLTVPSSPAFTGGGIVVLGGKHGVVGGTSAAAPQGGAIVAFANEARGLRGSAPLDIATAQLWMLAHEKNDYRQDFHDIT